MISDQDYFLQAAQVAKKSTCLKRRCGSVIVRTNKIIGVGYNSPPGNDPKNKRCHLFINRHTKRPTDKTCCVHAEQRAMFDALQKNPSKLKGADIYFASIDEHDQIERSGKPYCTHCSKMALDIGIKRFGLWHRSGIKMYDTALYNELSYNYNKRR